MHHIKYASINCLSMNLRGVVEDILALDANEVCDPNVSLSPLLLEGLSARALLLSASASNIEIVCVKEAEANYKPATNIMYKYNSLV